MIPAQGKQEPGSLVLFLAASIVAILVAVVVG
jgi:hypothetical protein